MQHDDFQTEPVRGLPETLPAGEHILWQGAPHWFALLRDALNLYWVAGYFAFLFVWRSLAGAATSPWSESIQAASFFLALGAIVVVLLVFVAWVQARATVYTITNRRVAMRIGAALTITLNLPFRQIANASLALRRDGTGTIALELMPSKVQLSYLNTWPHLRPWHMKRTQPALRCIKDAAAVARILSEAAETAVSQPVVTRQMVDAVAAE